MIDLSAAAASKIGAGDIRGARSVLAAAMMARPTSATCHTVAGILDALDAEQAGLLPVRVAILTNYTAEPMLPLLKARALPSGLKVVPYVGGFDSWMQDLLDEQSGLRRFDPQVVVLDLLAEGVVPQLTHEFLSLDAAGAGAAIEQMAAVMADGAAALRRWSRARLIVHLVPRPFGPTLGILDRGDRSQRAAIERLNQAIVTATEPADAVYVDSDRLVADVGATGWRDDRLWAKARMPYGNAALHRIADEYVRYLRALTGRVRKVLVLDLDDTLWGGVLGERGDHGIDLGPTHPGNGFVDFQRAIADLRRRGVLLAINSSNDADHALGVIDQHPAMVLRSRDFVAHRINWEDKAANMTALADELNVGLDSFVFVDNSDVECARIREALPEIITCQLTGDPSGYGPWLRQSGLFDALGFSEEDRQRTELYRGEVLRERHRSSVTSLDDYLESLGMTLAVEPLGAESLGRASDLTQRTNQFNMTTVRRTAAELGEMASGRHRGVVFSLTDRFGPQGIIAFAAVQHTPDRVAVITDLLISCRVLKRNVETAILSVLGDLARAEGAKTIAGAFRPTARNQAFADFYERHGFVPAPDGVSGAALPPDTRVLVRAADDDLACPPYIEVTQRAKATPS